MGYKQESRVMGVYKRKDGRWEVRYFFQGKRHSKYSRTKKGAEAKAAKLHVQFGTSTPTEPPLSTPQDRVEVTQASTTLPTKDDFITKIWAKVEQVAALTHANLQTQALDVITRAYKTVREDLEDPERKLTGLSDPKSMSNAELKEHIAQFKQINGATGGN